MIVTLLLAAGSSSRMRGADKLVEETFGQPLLRRQALAALTVGRVIVTLSQDWPERARAVDGLPLKSVPVKDAHEGMGASIRAGALAIPDTATGAMILPADMPEIGRADLLSMVQAHLAAPDSVVRGATEDGRLGHPVLFPARLFHGLRRLSGDKGAHDLMRGEKILPVPLRGHAALVDLDTPEEWEAWRAGL